MYRHPCAPASCPCLAQKQMVSVDTLSHAQQQMCALTVGGEAVACMCLGNAAESCREDAGVECIALSLRIAWLQRYLSAGVVRCGQDRRTAEALAPGAADEAEAGPGLHVAALRRQRRTCHAAHQRPAAGLALGQLTCRSTSAPLRTRAAVLSLRACSNSGCELRPLRQQCARDPAGVEGRGAQAAAQTKSHATEGSCQPMHTVDCGHPLLKYCPRTHAFATCGS